MKIQARILVVDDDPFLLEVNTRLLRRAGYGVLEAATGLEGLRLARQHRPDLVLLDVVLPDIDGFEVCRQIKTNPALADCFVVLLSASKIDSEIQAEGLESGADGYIARPVSNRELLARLEALLRLKEVEGDLRRQTQTLSKRVEELDCLFDISALVEQPGLSLEEILQGVANLIPPAMQYPQTACARIILKDSHYLAEDFIETPWLLTREILVNGRPVGRIDVGYLTEQPPADIGPFFKEEKNLLTVIAEQMGRLIERVWMERALRESEERYRLLSELTSDFAYALRVEPDGTLVREWITEAFNHITGFTIEEVSVQGGWEKLVHPDDRKIVRQQFHHLLSGQMDTCVLRIVTRSGETRWLHHYGRPVWDATQQRITHIYGAARDISIRKQTEIELNRLNRALKVLSEVNQALLRATEEADLLAAICRIVVEIGGYRLAWVGMAEHDVAKSVRPVAQAGYEAGYLEAVQITWADTEWGLGPSGKAIRTGQPQVIRNILTDPHFAPWRVEASQRGYASSIALPLLNEGQAFGILNIYAAEPDAFDTAEVQLLTELSWDLAFGINALRTQAEHRRAEELVHYQKTLLECQTEAAPEGILIVSDNGKWLTYNRRFIEMWGAPSEVIETGLRSDKMRWVMENVLNPQAFVNKVKYLYEHQDEQSYDEVRLKDGRIFERFSAPIVSKEAVHYGRVWYYRDITARQQAEEELRQREEEFRLIFEYSNDAIFWADVSTGQIINCNRKAEELLERSRDEIIGLPQVHLHPPDEAEMYRALFQQAIEHQAGEAIEAELYAASGKRIPVLISISIITIGSRTIIQGIFHDITERKRAEEALHISISAIESSINAIAIADLEGNLSYINRAFLKLWGYQDAQEVLGRSAVEFWEDKNKSQTIVDSLAKTGSWVGELTARRKNGEKFEAQLLASLVTDAAGKPIRLMASFIDITERKQTERALLDSEERFRLLAENAQDIIYRIRFWPQFGFEYVSPASTMITGYTPEEHYADPYLGFKLVHPDDRPILESLKSSLDNYNAPLVLRWVCKDGQVIWTEQRNVPLFDEQGHLIALQGIARDISQRVHAQEALKLEEMRLNSLLELSQKAHELSEQAIIQFTLEESVKFTHSAIGYLHFVNPDQNTIQLVTWSKDTLEICQATYESHYPLDQAGVWADCARLRRPVVHNDYQNLADKKGYPPGHVPLIRHLSVPVMDGDKVAIIMGVGNKSIDYDDSDVRQMLLTADHLWKIIRRKRAEAELRLYRDQLEERVAARTAELTQANEKLHREIIERKQVEAALRESEVRFRTVADFTYDWEYWVGANGDFIYVSPSCERITGYGPDEFQKEPELMPTIVHPEDQELYARHLWDEAQSDHVTAFDFRVLTRNGQVRWIGHICQPVYSTGGHWLGRRASNRDITEQKYMQTRLKEYAQHLEKLVDDKVHELELERAKTIQAAKMVALGEMATGVAHELNQPLTAMLLEADYLKKLGLKLKTVPPAQSVGLNGVELNQIGENLGRDIARCRRIIDHLRAFGRVSGAHTSSVNLNQPIQDSFILVGERLKNHEIEVSLTLSPHLPYIAADTHKLEQVFLNLINNAEYALLEMEQRVQATTGKIGRFRKAIEIFTDIDQDGVVAIVRDNGCGLSTTAKEHVFEPFFTTKPIGQGTGLGLSISYSIIREFGGEIIFESKENEGTTFTLRFPVIRHQPSAWEVNG